ncbi:hypothetical protein KC332_g6453 [Hortaea werneckii]|uniref:Something about silencing protein 4 domain-containing protein n=1 Tax=Hortaea werneckii TaxID=91943 RepID=A0A3M7IM91_HORWE|nr:hypothetical protein KC350_g15397 [Hortaea werneckii]KAI6822095.1 hypothetical protein KC358_g8927 [Hortaea werneckii]KAI6924276.1 hypothetical protein KC348_g9299 [Hortaea werneckii]KAI6935640.1 hypothetical protein KC341_g6786 [Hortaea werneckii]KAI6962284.1 hypothetical protein KC321_g11845 [Hortaea werneckii]
MVSSSRASRAPRTAGGRFAKRPQSSTPASKSRPAAAKKVAPTPSNTTTANTHHHDDAIPNSTDDDGFDESDRPAKKRKLSIRQKQTTLDAHFAPCSQSPNGAGVGATPKPPTKVTVAQPHGQLVETLNGVRAPLDVKQNDLPTAKSPERLPPQPKPVTKAVENKKEEKRTLRSQDEGPRLKSELATYFSEYEDVVFGTDKDAEFLTVDTALYITDDAFKKETNSSAALTPPKVRTGPDNAVGENANGGRAMPATPHRKPSQQYNGCSPVDLDKITAGFPFETEDPLDDNHFEKSHKRAERKEKQLRNIEKERAMHEKVSLERLLDGLLGHDWLKVLGITGVTDSEAKKYEKPRAYFVAEVQSLVDKFKMWKDGERRQRLEREAARRAEESSENEQDEADDGDESSEADSSAGPPSSELNAGATRQLLQETHSAVAVQQRSGFKIRLKKTSTSSPAATVHPPKQTPQPPAPSSSTSTARPPPSSTTMTHEQHVPPWLHGSPEPPITSFYAKRHLRDAALSKTRHGRNVTAFGHTLPEMPEEREFELPGELLTEEALRASARERRRRRREGVVDAGGSGSGGGEVR